MKLPIKLIITEVSITDTQRAFDMLRILILSLWIFEILDCLSIEPLLNKDIGINMKRSQEIKENKIMKIICPQVLSDKLKLLLRFGLIERKQIDPNKATEGYAITQEGRNALIAFKPAVEWAIGLAKKLKAKEKK